MKFDLIIANPPYGKPGANITKNIIDNVYFEEYVNLLPANDYKRNESKDLFKYAREMESIKEIEPDETAPTITFNYTLTTTTIGNSIGATITTDENAIISFRKKGRVVLCPLPLPSYSVYTICYNSYFPVLI